MFLDATRICPVVGRRGAAIERQGALDAAAKRVVEKQERVVPVHRLRQVTVADVIVGRVVKGVREFAGWSLSMLGSKNVKLFRRAPGDVACHLLNTA